MSSLFYLDVYEADKYSNSVLYYKIAYIDPF